MPSSIHPTASSPIRERNPRADRSEQSGDPRAFHPGFGAKFTHTTSRRPNILYDRLGAGEFFQFHTLPLEQRFFFEVVQRSGSYDLYGASNAPVRLAALAHHHGSISQIVP